MGNLIFNGEFGQLGPNRDGLQLHREGDGSSSGLRGVSNSDKCQSMMICGAPETRAIGIFHLGSQRNTMRAYAGSLRPAASGTKSYKNCPDPPGRPSFLAQAEKILLRIALFRPGQTSGQYLTRVAKASIPTRRPTGGLTPVVRTVAKGLAKPQGISFRFHNYIIAPDFLNVIRAVKFNNEFGLDAFVPFLLVLRAPSEALMMRRSSDTDMLSQFTPQERKVLAGIRIFQGEPLFW